MENLSSKTARELKEYAEENNIDLGDAKTKTKILSRILDFESNITAPTYSEEQNVITSPEPVKREPVSVSSTNDSGVIISKAAERQKQVIKEITDKPKSDKVAVYSEKNLRWNMVGSLKPGYNIVTKEAAEKWLTLPAVREATADEVATYYGKK